LKYIYLFTFKTNELDKYILCSTHVSKISHAKPHANPHANPISKQPVTNGKFEWI
jgi:hypothetical protein